MWNIEILNEVVVYKKKCEKLNRITEKKHEKKKKKNTHR